MPNDLMTAAGEHLTGILMDHGLMRGNINTAVLFRTAETKHVVILVDGSANCTQ